MKLRSVTAAAVFALVSLGSSAMAAVQCSNSASTTGSAVYIGCQAQTSGSLATGKTSAAAFSGYGAFNLAGRIDESGRGPFVSNPSGGSSGSPSFDTAQTGSYASGTKSVSDYVAQPVPEPQSYALMLAGLAVVGAIVRRRRML